MMSGAGGAPPAAASRDAPEPTATGASQSGAQQAETPAGAGMDNLLRT